MKKSLIIFLQLLLILQIANVGGFSSASASDPTLTFDLTQGVVNGTNYIEDGKVRLNSDKDLLVSGTNNVLGTSGETGSFANSPVMSQDGFLSREQVNENIGLVDDNSNVATPPLLFTISTDDGNQYESTSGGLFNSELAAMMEDSNNDCDGSCAVGEGWKNENYRYTAFVPSDYVSPLHPGDSGYATRAKVSAEDMQDLVAAGHEIGSHSVTHLDWSAGVNRNVMTNILYDIHNIKASVTTSYTYNASTNILTITESGVGGTVYTVNLSSLNSLLQVKNAIATALAGPDFTVNKSWIDAMDPYAGVWNKSNIDWTTLATNCQNLVTNQTCYISLKQDSNYYLTDAVIEAVLRDSKKSLEDKIGGGYEVTSYAYPNHSHDPHVMDLVKKYYIGARDGASSPNSNTGTRYPNGESNSLFIHGLGLYEASLILAEDDFGGWHASDNDSENTLINKFKGLVNCTDPNPLYCYAGDQRWTSIYNHNWYGWSRAKTDTQASIDIGKGVVRATLKAITELNQTARAAGKQDVVLVKNFSQAIEYLRSHSSLNYLEKGIFSNHSAAGTYMLMGQAKGLENVRNLFITKATSDELTNQSAINSAYNLPVFDTSSANPIWKIVYAPPDSNPTQSGITRSINQPAIQGHTYKMSLYACSTTGGTITPRSNSFLWNEGASLTLQAADCNIPSNWVSRNAFYSATSGMITDVSWTSPGLAITNNGQPSTVFVTGFQFYDTTLPSPTEFLNYTGKYRVGLNYPATNNIDYAKGSVGLWWKPIVNSDWTQDRPFFAAKGLRAFYDRKLQSIVFESQDSATDQWNTLKYDMSGTTFSADTEYRLMFTWDASLGKSIYLTTGQGAVGAAVASDSVAWEPHSFGLSDKIYVGSTYGGYDESQAYIKNFAVFKDALSASEVSSKFTNVENVTDNFLTSGTWDSPIQNVGYLNDSPLLNWNATLGDGAVRFQIRSANSEEDVAGAVWEGPNGGSDYYTTSGGALAVPNSSRYIQVRAYLSTTNVADSPTLNSLSLSYENDLTPPTLTTSPATNISTDESSTQISGSATDSGTGINNVKINGVTVSTDGSFSSTVNLNIGDNIFTIIATDNADNTTTKYLTITRTAVVADTTPPTIRIISPALVSPSLTPAASIPIISNSVSIMSTAGAKDIPLTTGSTASLTSSYPILHGTTTPNSIVELEIRSTNVIYASTTSDASGYWEYKVTQALEAGDYSVKITVKNKDTKAVISESSYNFQIAKAADAGTIAQPKAETQKESNNAWIYIGILIIILIGGPVLIYRKRKRK